MIGQVLTAMLLGLGTCGMGAAFGRWVSRRIALPTSTNAAVSLLLGIAGVGVLTLAIGHLGLLGPWVPWLIAGFGLIAGWPARKDALRFVQRAAAAIAAEARTRPLLAAGAAVAGLTALVATLAPPQRIDEVEYHWPAPLDWAASGGWTDSPFRHVDGFPLMEIIYTAAATQGSYVAAHAMSLLTMVGIGLAAAGMVQSLGLTARLPVAAAAVLMPVVWDGSYAAYNDTPGAAFTIAAAAVAVGIQRPSRAATALISALLAAAISIKPFHVVAVCCVALLLWHRFRRASLRSSATMAAVAAATVAFWSVRQWAYTGHLIDPLMFGGASGEAQARLPSRIQHFLAPIFPFVSGVLGAQEPWGARTSAVLQVFLIPSLVYLVWSGRSAFGRFGVLAGPAYLHWVVLGFVAVRTRFHIFTWVLLVPAVAYAVHHASKRWPRLGPWLDLAWTALVLLGALDVSFEMWRAINTIRT